MICFTIRLSMVKLSNPKEMDDAYIVIMGGVLVALLGLIWVWFSFTKSDKKSSADLVSRGWSKERPYLLRVLRRPLYGRFENPSVDPDFQTLELEYIMRIFNLWHVAIEAVRIENSADDLNAEYPEQSEDFTRWEVLNPEFHKGGSFAAFFPVIDPSASDITYPDVQGRVLTEGNSFKIQKWDNSLFIRVGYVSAGTITRITENFLKRFPEKGQPAYCTNCCVRE